MESHFNREELNNNPLFYEHCETFASSVDVHGSLSLFGEGVVAIFCGVTLKYATNGLCSMIFA